MKIENIFGWVTLESYCAIIEFNKGFVCDIGKKKSVRSSRWKIIVWDGDNSTAYVSVQGEK